MTKREFEDIKKRLNKLEKEKVCPDCSRCPTCGRKLSEKQIEYVPYPTWPPDYIITYTSDTTGTYPLPKGITISS